MAISRYKIVPSNVNTDDALNNFYKAYKETLQKTFFNIRSTLQISMEVVGEEDKEYQLIKIQKIDEISYLLTKLKSKISELSLYNNIFVIASNLEKIFKIVLALQQNFNAFHDSLTKCETLLLAYYKEKQEIISVLKSLNSNAVFFQAKTYEILGLENLIIFYVNHTRKLFKVLLEQKELTIELTKIFFKNKQLPPSVFFVLETFNSPILLRSIVPKTISTYPMPIRCSFPQPKKILNLIHEPKLVQATFFDSSSPIDWDECKQLLLANFKRKQQALMFFPNEQKESIKMLPHLNQATPRVNDIKHSLFATQPMGNSKKENGIRSKL